jgi:hypothetical protein
MTKGLFENFQLYSKNLTECQEINKSIDSRCKQKQIT